MHPMIGTMVDSVVMVRRMLVNERMAVVVIVETQFVIDSFDRVSE